MDDSPDTLTIPLPAFVLESPPESSIQAQEPLLFMGGVEAYNNKQNIKCYLYIIDYQ